MISLVEGVMYLLVAVMVLRLTSRWLGGHSRHPHPHGIMVLPVDPDFPTDYTPASILQQDPCAHPFSTLPLDSLMTHLYEEHFEVWNLLGEKGTTPQQWRKEHEMEHGVRR